VSIPGFQIDDVSTPGATIRTLRAGSGPPLLLLHGYPQTHVIWHKIASRLAEQFTVVLTDLRGYGDSSKPEGGERHANYAFRTMAQDQLEVMRSFGHHRFYVGSHDRGARTAHRLCLDHPEAVRNVCFMDIVPTLRMYRDTSMEFATKYMWWFFLIQKAPLPEHMIGLDPDFFLDQHFAVQNGTPGALTAEAPCPGGQRRQMKMERSWPILEMSRRQRSEICSAREPGAEADPWVRAGA